MRRGDLLTLGLLAAVSVGPDAPRAHVGATKRKADPKKKAKRKMARASRRANRRARRK